MRAAETHEPSKGDGKNREPSKCRMQNAGAARGHRGLQNARNDDQAKPVRIDRQPEPNRTY